MEFAAQCFEVGAPFHPDQLEALRRAPDQDLLVGPQLVHPLPVQGQGERVPAALLPEPQKSLFGDDQGPDGEGVRADRRDDECPEQRLHDR